MQNFEDKNIFIFCPQCSRLIKVILFQINAFHNQKNITFSYFCSSCYEYFLKQKNKDNKIAEKITINENIIKENEKTIDLIHYLKQFFYKPKIPCKRHKHNKMCFFYDKKMKEYMCISCVLEKNTKINSNIFIINKIYKVHLKHKKPSFSKIKQINKETDCVKCIVSICPYILCYVLDKRVIIWDYSLNKILYTFVESNYIQNIVPIKLYGQNNNNINEEYKEFDMTNLLLTYGSSLRLWNLKNIEKSKTPLLFQDNYCIIQEAIQIQNKNLIVFLSEDGLFIWDFTLLDNNKNKKGKNKKKEINELDNVISLSDLTSNFLFQINEFILAFGTTNKVYLYDYEKKIKNYIFNEDDNEEIIFGKSISFNRLALAINSNKVKIYNINTIIEEDEYDKDKKELKIDFKIIYETKIDFGQDYWKFYLEELNDLYIICFFDNNEIYLIDIFSDKIELLYKYDNLKNNKKGITKIKYIGNDKICILLNNESLNLLDINKKVIVTTFINPTYGQISTFKKLHNEDIAFGQIKQENFYSIGILE